ncbi:MAG: toxin co-regulated pilus biosynthesis Q family protein [Xanthomonadaceae bacterium]|nr:toxin co-regulated pilus biosynthesis Q family protein [Xanthomonadaceae bacterium]
MKRSVLSAAHTWVKVAIVAAVLAGCSSTPSAPEYRGRWKPVNRYSQTVEEIPLYQNYTFRAAPPDGTLKNMLTRWARDSQMTLVYQLPNDYTLYDAVGRINTKNAQEAALQLSEAYAEKKVSVVINNNQILVRSAGGPVDSAISN